MDIFRVVGSETQGALPITIRSRSDSGQSERVEYHKILLSVYPNEESRMRLALMSEETVEVHFSLADYIQFEIGDFIFFNHERFLLTSQYKPSDNTENGGYDYVLSFKADYWIANNRIFKLSGREQSWSLYETLGVHLSQWKKNLLENGFKYWYIQDGEQNIIYETGFQYRVEEYTPYTEEPINTAQKSVTYSKEYLVNALTRMAETWNCEWWRKKIQYDGWIYSTFVFGRCEEGEEIDLHREYDETLGEDGNIVSIEGSQSNKPFATRIYPYGSTRNLPPRYDKSLIFEQGVVNTEGSYTFFRDKTRELGFDMFESGEKVVITDCSGGAVSTSFNTPYQADKDAKIFERNITLHHNGKAKVVLSGNIVFSRSDSRKCTHTVKIKMGHNLFQTRFSAKKDQPYGTTYVSIPISFTYEGVFNVNDRITLSIALSRIYEGDEREYVDYGFEVTPSLSFSITSQVYKIETFVRFEGNQNDIPCVINYNQLSESTEGHDLIRVLTSSYPQSDPPKKYTLPYIKESKVPLEYYTSDFIGYSERRLHLDNSYDSSHDDYIKNGLYIQDKATPDDKVIEEVVVFDDVVPNATLRIKGQPQPYVVTDKPEDGGATHIYYLVRLERKVGNEWVELEFEKSYNDNYEPLMLYFNTGKLNGLSFNVEFYRNGKDDTEGYRQYEIIAQNVDNVEFPNSTFFPQEGDEVVLYNWDSSAIEDLDLVGSAREDLLNKAVSYLKRSKIDSTTYTVPMMSQYILDRGLVNAGQQNEKWVYDNAIFLLGQKIRLHSPIFSENNNTRDSRVIGIEVKIDIPYDTPVYTIGESPAYSIFDELGNKEASTLSPEVKSEGGGTTSLFPTGNTVVPIFINTMGAPQVIDGLDVPENIRTQKNVEAGYGVAAYGMASLAMNGGGGQGTVTAINFEGAPEQIYTPSDGLITLPDYPSLDGYATQAWVTNNFADKAFEGRVTAIESKIPAQASSTNQLADKNFVNSSVATATAEFQGTYDVVDDLGLSASATHAQIQSALLTAVASKQPDNNDYVFVSIPAVSGASGKYERYKFNGTAWAYEYTLNNSSFTAAQWASITSGITSAKVSDYDTHIARTDNPHGVTKAQVGLGNVENTALSTWTGSIKIVTLGTINTGVWHGSAIADDYIASASAWNAKQNALAFDGSYDASTNKVATKSTVTNAINALDVSNISGFGAGKTLASLTETDGKIAATFQNISITKSQVSDFPTAWALSNITGADDLKAIEALTGTSGFLKKTAANTWSLDTDVASGTALSGVSTRVGTLEGYFTSGVANNAAQLGGQLPSYYAVAADYTKTTDFQSFSIKAGSTTLGTYSPTSALIISLVAGSNISFTPDATNHKLTINNNYSYTLPMASADSRGGIRVGNTLNIDSNGILNANIYDGLDQGYTTYALSAKQGKVLNTALDTLKTGLTSKGAHNLPIYLNSSAEAVAIDALSVSGNVESTAGGVSAMGIASLALNGGGGQGTLTQIQVNGVALADTSGVVNITATTGNANGKIAIAGQQIPVYGLGSLAYLSSLAFTDLSSHPTTLSGYGITDAKIANGVITLGGNTITPLTGINADMINTALGFTLSGTSGQTYSLATISSNASNGNTAYGWGNHANAGYFAASSFTKANIKSTLGISDWALAASKPSYTHNEIGAGNLTIGNGANNIFLRTDLNWASAIYHHTNADEAVVFLNKGLNVTGISNYTTSWIFAYGTPSERPAWTSLTPALQIKGQCVAINKLIGSRVGGAYNLDVNGTLNATTIYQNGTALATVATSGSYNDLSDKPTIPTVNNGNLYLQASGTTKVTFTANQSGNSTFNIATGSANGTLSIGGTDVAVKGLGNSAYVGYDTAVTKDSTNLITSGAVWTAIDNLPEPMVFKGSLGTGGTITALPVNGSASIGDTYKVITAGTYASKAAKVGDTFICLTKTSSANTWELIPSGDEPSGTVTSVGLSMPTGFSVSSSPVTTSGTLTVAFASGYSLPTTAKQTNWDDAYDKRHTHSSLTLSTTAQAYDGTHTLALPASDPYTSARTPSSHASSGTGYGVGTTSNYGHVKLATGDMNGASGEDGVACGKNHTHSQYGLASDVTTLQGYFTSGVANKSAILYNATVLDTSAKLDAFHEAYTLKYAVWNGFNTSVLNSNGLVIDGGYTSTNYGFQILIDDDPTYIMALRQRSTGGWSAWKRIPMGDGTGASGTWGISVSGDANGVRNYNGSRQTADNIKNLNDGALHYFLEGNGWRIIHTSWDNNGYDTQIAIPDHTIDNESLKWRSLGAASSHDTYEDWRNILDSSNYTDYTVKKDGTGATGTWAINVTGSAGSVAWANVSNHPTKLSQFTNDSGFTTNTGTVTSITLKAGTGISLDVDNTAITTSGTRTITNAGVRAATINGNYLRINTNGTNADLTIPYATNADTVDGYHASKSGVGDLVAYHTFSQTGNAFSYFKIGTLPTVAGTSSGESYVIFELYNFINFGGNKPSKWVVTASSRQSYSLRAVRIIGVAEISVGYVIANDMMEIWVGATNTWMGKSRVRVDSSSNFTADFSKTTTKPANWVNGTTDTTAYLTSNVASATKLETARSINGTSFDGTADITTANWGTARNISIADSDSTNTGTAVSVNGSAAVTLKLPATIKATLSGNASSATKATNDSDGNAINTTYLKKSGGAMTGMVTWAGGNAINFRTGNAGYNAIMGYYTPGNEALVLGFKNSVTSFIVRCGVDLSDKSDWQSTTIGTPSIQVKGQSLYVNHAIANNVSPSYNFYVGGSMGISGQITSTVATGTAPLVIASTTAVTNLNADLLDGQHGSYYATASSVTTLQGYFDSGVAKSAAKLTTVSKTAWGKTFWTSGGIPDSIDGDMANVGNIAFSASGKNIGGTMYFDTTNHRVGINDSTPSCAFDVTGDIQASGGVAAGGILNLAYNGAGTQGTLTQIQINGRALTDSSGIVNIPLANTTSTGDGAMSHTDKLKLDGIATGATNVTTDTVAGWGYVKDATGIANALRYIAARENKKSRLVTGNEYRFQTGDNDCINIWIVSAASVNLYLPYDWDYQTPLRLIIANAYSGTVTIKYKATSGTQKIYSQSDSISLSVGRAALVEMIQFCNASVGGELTFITSTSYLQRSIT